MSDDDNEIRERLVRLERSNRRMKFLNTLAVICLAAVVSMGAQQATKRTVEANEFVLRAPDGHVRAMLTADSMGDASLVFLDESEKIKGIFAADRLVFSDWSGNARIALRPSPDGGTVILGRHDGWGLELSSTSKEAGMYIAKGWKQSAGQWTPPRDEDLLAVSIQKSGNGLQDGPAIELSDGGGFRTRIGRSAVLGKPTTSAASLRLEGPDGKLIWSAP